MEIKRTANAGVLIKTNGTSVLLDGICNPPLPYLAIPNEIKNEIISCLPNIVGFTHTHNDHFDNEFAEYFSKITGEKVIMTPNICVQKGNVKVMSVKTRHLGKSDVAHISFVVMAENKCIWFSGDAAPVSLLGQSDLPKPDILIVPFAYVNTASSFNNTLKSGAKEIIVVHMPSKENDIYNIYQSVENVVNGNKSIRIPKIGETICI